MDARSSAGKVKAKVPAPAGDVFAAVTDIGRLAAWNDRIEGIETPVHELGVGDRWAVRMALPGKRFTSVSEVIELDRSVRRFSYRSKPDDDNPSATTWTWEVAEVDDGGSEVTVSWSLRPRTPGRRVIAAVRRRMIPKEVSASIGRLATICAERGRAGD